MAYQKGALSRLCCEQYAGTAGSAECRNGSATDQRSPLRKSLLLIVGKGFRGILIFLEIGKGIKPWEGEPASGRNQPSIPSKKQTWYCFDAILRTEIFHKFLRKQNSAKFFSGGYSSRPDHQHTVGYAQESGHFACIF